MASRKIKSKKKETYLKILKKFDIIIIERKKEIIKNNNQQTKGQRKGEQNHGRD